VHASDIFVDPLYRSHDHQGVMNGRTNCNLIFDPQAASQPEHFRAIGLHEKVAKRARIEVRSYMVGPAENGLLPSVQNSFVNSVVQQAPKHFVNLAVHSQQVSRYKPGVWPSSNDLVCAWCSLRFGLRLKDG